MELTLLFWLMDSQKKSISKKCSKLLLNIEKTLLQKELNTILKKAKDRGHIVEGLMVAIANIDEVITIIKKSKDPKVSR